MGEQTGAELPQHFSPLPKGENFRQLRETVRAKMDQARKVLETSPVKRLSEHDLKMTQIQVAGELARESIKNDLDSLTQIFNRVGITKRLEEEIQLEKRLKYPSTLALLDLNGLKTINDTQGHEDGDRYLKEFAVFLKSITRNTDFVSRYGGDEFLVLLRGADLEHAQLWLEKVKEALNETTMSASIGLTPFNSENIKEMIQKADQEMYKAKQEYYDEHGIERRQT